MSTYRDLRRKQIGEVGEEREIDNVIQEVLITNGQTTETSMNIPNDEVEELPPTEIAESTNKDSCSSKKHRGPTKLAKVHARTIEERQMIILNSYGQPIGPTHAIVRTMSWKA